MNNHSDFTLILKDKNINNKNSVQMKNLTKTRIIQSIGNFISTFLNYNNRFY